MNERKVIGACVLSRKAYDKVVQCKYGGILSEHGKAVFEEVKEFYEKDVDATCADTEVLSARIKRKFPKHFEDLVQYIHTGEAISPDNIAHEIAQLRVEWLQEKILTTISSGKSDKAAEFIEEWMQLRAGLTAEAETTLMHDINVGDLVSKIGSENRIKVAPSALNKQLKGGALRKNHIVVFAPTDMGKTLLSMYMGWGFCKQGLRTGYFGNEDAAEALMMRFVQCAAVMTEEEVEANPMAANERAKANGMNNFYLWEMAPGSPQEIEALAKEYKLDVIIVDQLRNLDVGESNKVLQMEKAATAIRGILKRNNLLGVSVTQAGESAFGKIVLTKGDIDYSNVGIPGQADLMIGIGASEEMEMMGERMLSLCKNKISGVKTHIPVKFDNFKMRVT